MKILNFTIIVACIFVFLQCKLYREKTILNGQVWEDNKGARINAHGGGILLVGDTYYWYGEHKREGKDGGVAMDGVHCYSSRDLRNWSDEGIVLHVEKDPNSDILEGCILERPKVIYNKKNNNYVMWFHLELKGMGYDAARSGVAISNSPTGPFTFLKSFRPNADIWPQNVLELHKKPISPSIKGSKFCGGPGCLPAHPDSINILGRDFEGGQMARDQNLFVDDDGKAYHIYSSEDNSTLHISLLSDDYQSDTGIYYRCFINRYMEAAAVFKHDGNYYLIASDCTGWNPNTARSAVAPTIFGPWKELGNPCTGKDADKTFFSQSSYVLPVTGRKDTYIAMFDRWNKDNLNDSRYVWLPLTFENDKFLIPWNYLFHGAIIK